MEIKFREWADLLEDERVDGIYTTRAWLRGEFALLLPCDISDACKDKFIDSARRAEHVSASCKRTMEAMQ
jgi:hypothetical protein